MGTVCKVFRGTACACPLLWPWGAYPKEILEIRNCHETENLFAVINFEQHTLAPRTTRRFSLNGGKLIINRLEDKDRKIIDYEESPKKISSCVCYLCAFDCGKLCECDC